jgi:hypothetical protein
MDEQPALGTILFHVALLTIIVILVDARLMRGALAILPPCFWPSGPSVPRKQSRRRTTNGLGFTIGEWTCSFVSTLRNCSVIFGISTP